MKASIFVAAVVVIGISTPSKAFAQIFLDDSANMESLGALAKAYDKKFINKYKDELKIKGHTLTDRGSVISCGAIVINSTIGDNGDKGIAQNQEKKTIILGDIINLGSACGDL